MNFIKDLQISTVEEILEVTLKARRELAQFDDQFLSSDLSVTLDEAYWSLDELKAECIDELTKEGER